MSDALVFEVARGQKFWELWREARQAYEPLRGYPATLPLKDVTRLLTYRARAFGITDVMVRELTKEKGT